MDDSLLAGGLNQTCMYWFQADKSELMEKAKQLDCVRAPSRMKRRGMMIGRFGCAREENKNDVKKRLQAIYLFIILIGFEIRKNVKQHGGVD